MNAVNEYPVNRGRISLGEAVPLPTPFVIYLEPTRFCNLRCSFCSNPHLPAEERFSLPEAVYMKLMEDICAFDDNIKVLSINGVGEPLVHKDLVKYVRIAKNSGRVNTVRVITNGTLLTPQINDGLLDAGLDMLWISVEAMSSRKYQEITGVPVQVEELAANVADFYAKRGTCKVYVKIANVGLEQEDERKKFYDMFGNISDNIMVENITNIYGGIKSVVSEGVLTNRFSDQPVEYFDICDYLFKGIAVNADGTCSPCPVDWRKELVVGDIREQSLREIWNGEPLRKLRLSVLRGNIANMIPCSNCYLYLNAESSVCDIKSMIACRDNIIERLERQ